MGENETPGGQQGLVPFPTPESQLPPFSFDGDHRVVFRLHIFEEDRWCYRGYFKAPCNEETVKSFAARRVKTGGTYRVKVMKLQKVDPTDPNKLVPISQEWSRVLDLPAIQIKAPVVTAPPPAPPSPALSDGGSAALPAQAALPPVSSPPSLEAVLAGIMSQLAELQRRTSAPLAPPPAPVYVQAAPGQPYYPAPMPMQAPAAGPSFVDQLIKVSPLIMPILAPLAKLIADRVFEKKNPVSAMEELFNLVGRVQQFQDSIGGGPDEDEGPALPVPVGAGEPAWLPYVAQMAGPLIKQMGPVLMQVLAQHMMAPQHPGMVPPGFAPMQPQQQPPQGGETPQGG